MEGKRQSTTTPNVGESVSAPKKDDPAEDGEAVDSNEVTKPQKRCSILQQKRVDPRKMDEQELNELGMHLSRQEYTNELIRKIMEVVPIEKERDKFVGEVRDLKAELEATRKKKKELEHRLLHCEKDFADRELDLAERAMSVSCELLEGAGADASELAERLKEVRGPSVEILRLKANQTIGDEPPVEAAETRETEVVERRPSILNTSPKKNVTEESPEKKHHERSRSFESILATAAESSQGHLKMGRALLKQMESAGVQATANTFHNLLRMCHRHRKTTNWSDVQTLISEATQKEVVLARASWCLLLDICASAGNVQHGIDLLRQIKSANVALDAEIFRKLLRLCTKQRVPFPSTIRIFDIIERNLPLSKFEPSLIIEACLCYERSPDSSLWPRLENFFNLLPENPETPSAIELKKLPLDELHVKAQANGIREPSKASKRELVEDLFQILKSQPRHTEDTFTALVRASAKTHEPAEVMAILARARGCLSRDQCTEKLYRAVWRAVSGVATLCSSVEGIAAADGIDPKQLRMASTPRSARSPRTSIVDVAKGQGKGVLDKRTLRTQ